LSSPLDIIFAGAGLANGLAAYRIKRARPELRILVVDCAAKAGGNHTWSFHHTDIDDSDRGWIEPFVSCAWENHRVVFPEFSREISGKYYSIRSEKFHDVLSHALQNDLVLNQVVQKVNADGIILEGKGEIKAKAVIDGRGWSSNDSCPLGYQKFLGQFVRTKQPHGLVSPILMDVTWPQIDGFRFFYVLPFGVNSLLIEDTRYSDTPEVDIIGSRKAIRRYAELKGWEVDSIEHEEVGSLPIPLSGERSTGAESVVQAGLRAGLFHATTGYSFPNAVRFATALLGRKPGELEGSALSRYFSHYSQKHWEAGRFYRFLNRMLFEGAAPAQRFRVLQRFYRLPESSIARFYAGKLNWRDKARILLGKPPIPVWNAIRCLGEGRRDYAYNG
jgi:lycopene beta-cyclase